MNSKSELEILDSSLGQVRAEYEDDVNLQRSYTTPQYFQELLGITPTFLIGGRGTGKTTTLRSMAFAAQAQFSGTKDPREWKAIGAYWKIEPSVVSAFQGKGIDAETWQRAFSHYINLRLSGLFLEYLQYLQDSGAEDSGLNVNESRLRLFTVSANLPECSTIDMCAQAVDYAIASIEAKLNGNISRLREGEYSVAGKPLAYLFGAVDGAYATRRRPFMFCLDEYENLNDYQQVIVNTLIKETGTAPFTFKIGVRNTVAIERATAIAGQPLQFPADFAQLDIVDYLKDESFENFASSVLRQRLTQVNDSVIDLSRLLPTISMEDEALLLGGDLLQRGLADQLRSSGAPSEVVQASEQMTPLEASLALRWSESHDQSAVEVIRYALAQPDKWATRVDNYGYATLFTIRQRRVGTRKYYSGWKTFCQLADGNIRYLIRLVYESFRLHLLAGGSFDTPVNVALQTRAAARVGEITIRDLEGWSKQGAALTRLTLGLGSIFGTLAREAAFATPEVDQFRIAYRNGITAASAVDSLLGEAIGQGLITAFDGDKNGRRAGATRELDYQLHPVLAPYFGFSARRGRRLTLRADDLLALTSRESASNAIQRVLAARNTKATELPDQLVLFEDMT